MANRLQKLPGWQQGIVEGWYEQGRGQSEELPQVDSWIT